MDSYLVSDQAERLMSATMLRMESAERERLNDGFGMPSLDGVGAVTDIALSKGNDMLAFLLMKGGAPPSSPASRVSSSHDP